MKNRLIAAFLLATMILGSVACTDKGGGLSPDDTTNLDSSAITTAGNLEGTESEPTPGDTTNETPGGDEMPALDATKTDLTVLGSTGEGGTGIIKETTYAFGTEEGNAYFSTTAPNEFGDSVIIDGNKATLHESTVAALRFGQAFKDGTVAKYQAKIQVSDVKESAWIALFIGLRLADEGNDATSQSGVWLALQKDAIGLRTGNWPENFTYFTVTEPGMDFSKERMFYIEDDMDKDVITISADNDNGEKKTVAICKIEDNKINLYKPGTDTPVASDPITGSILPNGRVSFWLHHTKTPAVITGLTATGTPDVRYTVPQANMMAGWDILSDTWVSVDDLGRVTATDNGPVTDKKVGIFYFLWHDGTSGQPIYDHSAAYEQGGSALLKETIQAGPLGFAHYWAEPYFGYYRSDDEWVIRKHTQQLNAAGVDFIFIDATNGLTYEQNYEAILKVWSEMRAEGNDTPQIMFHCGNTASLARNSFNALWKNLYSTGRYEDLWFKYQGKALIFMPRSVWTELSQEQKAVFTYRQSWANTNDSWYSSFGGKNCWPWADMYPQKPGLSLRGEMEQMIVMSGFWANGSYGTNGGRSFSGGVQPAPTSPLDFSYSLVPKTSGLGLAFEEQFNYAIEKDPGLIMLVGWNEWWAGRWEGGAAVGQTIANSYKVTDDNAWTKNYYVDCFNPEYSRDIEPVKGYFNDNYYYQMAQNIREYKGSRVPLAAFGQTAIDINGSNTQWHIVGPEYRDYVGDVVHRNWESYVGQLTYTNDSGRNDFTVAKVSRHDGKVYFYAECADTITAAEGTNWMNLYIDADCNAETGWHGYDFIINRTRNGNTCSIQKFKQNTWDFEDVGTAAYVVRDNYIQIQIDATLLGLGDTFDFKWADNSVDTGDIMQFIDMGDTAPSDRFNYRYTTTQATIDMPEVMTDDLVILKAGSYFAYVNGKLVRLDERSTKATFFGDADHLYLPLSFAKDTLGLDVAGATVYNHYGVAYVDVATALESSGKTVSRTDSMVVLGSKTFTEDELLTMYRAMY